MTRVSDALAIANADVTRAKQAIRKMKKRNGPMKAQLEARTRQRLEDAYEQRRQVREAENG